MAGWVAGGLSKNKANSVKPVETGFELGLSLAMCQFLPEIHWECVFRVLSCVDFRKDRSLFFCPGYVFGLSVKAQGMLRTSQYIFFQSNKPFCSY